MIKATVNADASFCPRTRAAGWATWIAVDGGLKIRKSGQFHRLPRNPTVAELWALLNGAFIAVEHGGARDLLLQSDCKGALKIVATATHYEVRELLARVGNVSISTKHVKAHTHTATPRHWVNDWCDKEAKKWMRSQRKTLRPAR